MTRADFKKWTPQLERLTHQRPHCSPLEDLPLHDGECEEADWACVILKVSWLPSTIQSSLFPRRTSGRVAPSPLGQWVKWEREVQRLTAADVTWAGKHGARGCCSLLPSRTAPRELTDLYAGDISHEGQEEWITKIPPNYIWVSGLSFDFPL